MVTLSQNKALKPGDLGITVRDEAGLLTDPAGIAFTIFAIGENDARSLISQPKMVPTRASVGVYYLNMTIPSMWQGKCDLVWYIQLQPGGREDTVHEEFEVAAFDPLTANIEAPSVLLTSKPGLPPRVVEIVMATRELLADTNPDRNYHFRPPTPGKVVAGFTTRVGFIWLDTTIIRLARLTTAQLNSWNPLASYNHRLESLPPNWGEAVALGTAAKCLSSEGARWTADSFEYSLNGVSLNVQKQSDYMALAAAYGQEFETWAPLLTANRPATLGLRQQRWLLG